MTGSGARTRSRAWDSSPATLDGLAGVAALRVAAAGPSAAERALRLAGMAAASGGVLGRGHHWHTALAARWLAPAFAALGGRCDPVAEKAWAAGQALTAEQAIAYALEVDDQQ